MLPNFMIEEATVRESGESTVFDMGSPLPKSVLLTLGITHAVEQESIEVEIYGSAESETWSFRRLLRIPRKSYCGVYQIPLNCPGVRYLKACWLVNRWSRTGEKPFFRFYVSIEAALSRAAMAGAA